jgi:hypothetical protein
MNRGDVRFSHQNGNPSGIADLTASPVEEKGSFDSRADVIMIQTQSSQILQVARMKKYPKAEAKNVGLW